MRKITILLIMTLFITLYICAGWDMVWQDGNEFNITVTNYGIIGHNVQTGNAGGYWPSGYPGENYIFGAGIWFGGLVDHDNDGIKDTLVTVGYNPNSAGSEMCPGDGSDAPEYDNSNERVYISTSSWPPKNSNGEILFDSMLSYSDIYAHYSDLDPARHFTTENKPLGLDVQLFSYTYPSKLVEDIVYFRLVIKNVRDDNKDIENAYVGICMDNDIGNEASSAANDILGFIDTMTVNGTLRQLSIGYQFQTEAEAGWAHTPSIMSAKLLGTPSATDSVDLYHDGSYIIPAGSPLGMTSFNSFTLATDPGTKEERYKVMAGYNHLTFDPANPENSYEPFPSWGTGTAGYPGQTEGEWQAGDKRFLLSCGPFDISYGDSVIYTFGLCINRTANDIVPNMMTLEELWANRNNITYTLLSPVDNEIIDTNHTFSWDNSASYDSVAISIVNQNTNKRSAFFIISDNGTETVNTDTLPDGYYSWQVFGFDSMMFQGRSRNENFILNKQTENCTPIISEFIIDTIDEDLKLSWKIKDVDDSIFDNTVYFLLSNYYTGYDTIRVFKGFNDSFAFNCHYLLPLGYYKIVLISSDGASSDSISKFGWLWNYNNISHEDTIQQISGESAAIISVDIYDSTKTIPGNYYVYMDNPFPYDYLEVYNSDIDSVLLSDNYINPYVYKSDMFSGLGVRIYMNEYISQADSVSVIEDMGGLYSYSNLQVANKSDYNNLISVYNKLLGARDILIEWETVGDTAYPVVYCEDHPGNIMSYDSTAFERYRTQYTYCFTDSNNNVQAYPDTNTYCFYIAEYVIYKSDTSALFNSISEIPDDGEVWRIYTTGSPYMPLEGDTFRFTIENNDLVQAASKEKPIDIFMKNVLGREQIEFSIEGDENVDIVIYDITGRQVDAVYSGNISGSKELTYNIKMPKGIYFIKDKLSDFNEKIIILK
ncbi:MAG: T9SS type A sorting domain-containing protein [candidate division WOR-3 bacterium]|nr:T9SS type A sorting domain-containing protein [candidate division WOR-3 bacterium]